MATLNGIVYIIGTKNTPLTVTQIINELKEEGDYKHRYDRVHSFMVKFSYLFNKKSKDKRVTYSLNYDGKRMFERIEYNYDPITGTLLE